MLTRKQRELLDFIRGYQKREEGISPTFQEMVTGVGLKTRSGVHRLLVQLEERGFIRRLKNRSRAIEVLVKNGVMLPTTRQLLQEFTRNYAVMPGSTEALQQLPLKTVDSELANALLQMSTSGKPYKVSIIVRLQELGGQG